MKGGRREGGYVVRAKRRVLCTTVINASCFCSPNQLTGLVLPQCPPHVLDGLGQEPEHRAGQHGREAAEHHR